MAALEAQLLQQQQQSTIVPSAVQSVSTNLRPLKPDAFDGRKVESFISTLEDVIELEQRHSSDEQKITWARTFFRDRVSTWARGIKRQIESGHISDDESPFNDWNRFKAALRRAFNSSNTEDQVRSKLSVLTQVASVQRYTDAFNELINEISDMDEKTKVHTYKRGLKPNIAMQVATQRPKRLDEAQALALDMDVIIYNELRSRKGVSTCTNGIARRSFTTGSFGNGAVPMEIGNVVNEYDDDDRFSVVAEEECAAIQSRGPVPARSYTGDNRRLSDEDHRLCRQENRCFKCKQIGHRAWKCSKNIKSESTKE
jgi:hypothetical protein